MQLPSGSSLPEKLSLAINALARLPLDAPEAPTERDAIDSICVAARILADAEGACVVLREGELVHYSREDTMAPLWAGQRFPIGNCISGWSILHRARVVIEDVYQDPRIPLEYYRPTFVRSLAMQPIAPADPIGAIGVYWARVHTPDEEQLAELEKLAGVAALLIRNVRLRGELEAARRGGGAAPEVDLQERLHRAENTATRHAEEARLREEFLATVSHELRSPLNAILGWTRVLQSQSADDDVRNRALEVIQRNIRVQAQLLDDLIDISRAVAGKLSLHLESVDLAALVRSAVESAQPEADAKNIELRLALAAAPLPCTGDPHRLQQVLRNLVSNALKFTPAGGRVDVSLARAAGLIRLTVADNGMGIEPSFLPFVFERFRQAERAQTANPSGLGLGLAIAREIVAGHGGEIACHSEGLGRGATITVTLPLAG